MDPSSSNDAANVDIPTQWNGGGTRVVRFLWSRIASLLENSGVIRLYRPEYSYAEALPLVSGGTSSNANVLNPGSGSSNSGGGDGELSIRVMEEEDGASCEHDGADGLGFAAREPMNVEGNGGGAAYSGGDGGVREGSSYQTYDIQRAASWIEQVFPFSLLLLIVFIRQHLQGFVVTLFSTIVLYKFDDILRKQTALKGERKIVVLIGYSLFLMLYIFGIYWCNWRDGLFLPLPMVPPMAIPPFWHAIFIILVNDIMARQASMVLKFLLLLHYKNGKGHNFRQQGQMLTLVEYTLHLYRALLPTPVWYRFFLNRDYGNLFSSLTTGLYLTLKLTSTVDKVRSLFAAVKELSRKEVHYGSHATPEQVNAVGDICAICQEKMQAPIFLRCHHIFCEDCVSEWFDRERTCPLCRALVRPADIKSYGDGSTSLYLQIF